jgi:hypothetical protein
MIGTLRRVKDTECDISKMMGEGELRTTELINFYPFVQIYHAGSRDVFAAARLGDNGTSRNALACTHWTNTTSIQGGLQDKLASNLSNPKSGC